MRGMHSLCLWGPGEGFGAYFPETEEHQHTTSIVVSVGHLRLSSSQWEG